MKRDRRPVRGFCVKVRRNIDTRSLNTKSDRQTEVGMKIRTGMNIRGPSREKDRVNNDINATTNNTRIFLQQSEQQHLNFQSLIF